MKTFFENNNYINIITSYDYLMTFLIPVFVFVVTLVTIKVSKKFITLKLSSIAKKTTNEFDDLIVNILRVFNLPFYVIISLLISIRFTNLIDNYRTSIHNISIIVVTLYAIKILKIINNYIFEQYVSKEIKATNSFKSIINIIIYIIGFVIILQNFGYDISTLVAGLGIGGVAIAFAIQNILSDIFSSFSIYLDKPFNEGDFIQIGQDSGTVKKIGVKSTRIITLQGEELVVSNKELTTSRVRNYKQMKKRRISFTLRIDYSNSHTKVLKAKEILTRIIENTKDIELDRVTVLELSNDNITYEIVYYVNNQDYSIYMGAQESINLSVLKEFATNKISLAYPTNKVIVDK